MSRYRFTRTWAQFEVVVGMSIIVGGGVLGLFAVALSDGAKYLVGPHEPG